MPLFNPPLQRRCCFECLIALVLVLFGSLAQASPSPAEASRLELLVRQLDTLSRIAAVGRDSPTDDNARVYFDYERLSADIAVIRQGIKAHQSPSRAQPRHPPELTGHYTRQREPNP